MSACDEVISDIISAIVFAACINNLQSNMIRRVVDRSFLSPKDLAPDPGGER
jgi:hypothetical protein